jgi:two-component system, NtrC family, sensor kinase
VKAFSGPERTSMTKGSKSVRKPPIGRKVPAARKRAPADVDLKKENATLRRELAEALERQTATSEVLQVISDRPGELAPVFQSMVENATRVCGAKFGTLFLLENGNVRRVASYNMPPAFADRAELRAFRPHLKSGIGRVIRSKQVIQVADIRKSPAYLDGDPAAVALAEVAGARTLIVVPMLGGVDLIGLITVYRQEVQPFTDNQIELLNNFAKQAIIAIENTRLFNETQEALERQTATADILKVIASSPSDTQPVFDAIARRANTLIGGFSSTVFRFINGIAYLEAFTPTTPAADEVLKTTFPRPVADFAPFRMAQAGEVTQIPDTEASTYELQNISRARGYRGMLYAPLMSDGMSIGFIAVTRVQPGTFPEHHVQLLRTFADQAVIAIENARLFEEVQAKTRDLTEALTYQTGSASILNVIASSPTDVGPVLKAIVESACELCEAYDAVVRLKDGDDLQFSAHHGPIPISMDKLPINRNWTSGRAVIDKKPVHVHDLLSAEGDELPEAQEMARRMGHRTILSVPLLREDESIGAILLRRTEVHPFSDKQIALLQTFADQAVIAIGNIRMFEQVQQRTKELSLSLEELRAAQDRLVQTEKLASLGQLTAGIAHEIKNPLNFVNNFSALSAELIDELDDVLKPAALDSKTREETSELTRMLKSNLEKVVQHGKRADSIVKNMLLHYREGSGERRPVNLNALVDESLNLAYHGARAENQEFKIRLERSFDPATGEVDLFPQEMTRALLNLISNGFYAATKRKAKIGVDEYEPTLSAVTKNFGNSVEITIRDNGSGIPPEVREKMFNPFFTTKPPGEGTGLGLSLSYDIVVKQHGGSIEVDTRPDEFTEFKVILLRTAATSKAGADK